VTLFIDLFNYLSLVLHGLSAVAQTVAIGSVAFACAIVQPLLTRGAAAVGNVRAGTVRILRIAAAALAVLSIARIGLQLAAIVGAGIPLDRAFGAPFVFAWALQSACAAALAILAGRMGHRYVDGVLILLALGVLAGSVAASHAVARIDDRSLLILATTLHQAGAGVWIGGLPTLMLALATVADKRALAFIGRRYSSMALVGVAALLTGTAVFAAKYIGSADAMYGTAYGFMSGVKLLLFLTIAAFGAANFFLVRRLNRDSSTPTLRFRRFVEVEFGLGLAALLAASSLTSVPPAVDLVEDRVTLQEIVDRYWPVEPTWTSPAQDELVLSQLRRELATEGPDPDARALALVPGSGVRLAYNDADKLWSAFNHNWAGVFVLAGGLLALSKRFGFRPGQNWPLVFLGLAIFLFIRSDADAWPTGDIGFWESFRDPEILQHRAVLPLIVAIGFFERSVQTGRLRAKWATYVFPLMCIVGGLVLLTHSHSIDDGKEVVLIEMSHSVMAMLALAIGWARWLELRTGDGLIKRVSAWVWPIGLALMGAVLIGYREL
jgi:putative copper resistance protein D